MENINKYYDVRFVLSKDVLDKQGDGILSDDDRIYYLHYEDNKPVVKWFEDGVRKNAKYDIQHIDHAFSVGKWIKING